MADISLFDSRLFYIGEIVQFYQRLDMDESELELHPRRELYTIKSVAYNIDLEENTVQFQSMETGYIFETSEELFCGPAPEGSKATYAFEKFPLSTI